VNVIAGKMCLFNEALAKKCVAAFARELEVCKDFVIRSNIVMVMCDLSIR
jgi:condensin-2 complex subunit D3